MNFTNRLSQYVSIAITQIVTFFILSHLHGLQIKSLESAIGIALAFLAAEIIYWWSFINFFSYLPVWLYPLITFILSGGILMLIGNWIPGIIITDLITSLEIIMILTGMKGIAAGILSVDIDQQFDRQVMRNLIARHIKPQRSDIPGFLYIEIDGLSEKSLIRAMQSGKLPTLQRWFTEKSHKLISWETDFSSQSGAMQSGILFGNNSDFPGFRWWDRENQHTILSGNFWDAEKNEKRLSNGHGLLAEGGASRSNLFSGDAAESILTISTVLNRNRETGPGFYMYLVNPFVIGRILTDFLSGVIIEWLQSLWQRIRRDPFTVKSRNFLYAFTRAAESRFLQYITTLLVVNDTLRGLPAIYATYAGFDGIAHNAGANSTEAFQTLREIDRQIARLEHITHLAPRPYHIVILSDHGQSTGLNFRKAHGVSLEKLVRDSINNSIEVIETAEITETWARINAFLNDSIHVNSRMARVLRTMVRSKLHNGLVEIANRKSENAALKEQEKKAEGNSIIVYASGCVGLIYFREACRRLTYEEIQERHPNLILSLISQPGIGFLLVRSSDSGNLVIGSDGIRFLDHDTFEGRDPLADYSVSAPSLLRRESSFANCPDLIVNSRFDPQSGLISSFEDQISHHGGLGGEQNFPFLLYPAILPYNNKPLVGAESIYRLLRKWRLSCQNIAKA